MLIFCSLTDLSLVQSNRLKQVQDHLNTLNSLCSVMGMDFKLTATEVHPSLGDSGGSRSISNNTLEQLGTEINKLREVKIQRMERVKMNFSILHTKKSGASPSSLIIMVIL